ncbi:hypothetical protein [Pseudomonas costantinii]|uniref:Uncharacterized protein n=1 Tax=Pseudomonas costantinii TaxID=168469 RepID=A0A1S2UVT2_9PSED|nr:hypothetical protein [Pseudomonas costantinii]NVZ21055.1 hypothetical protein [Pseudomonas costantinii]OIN50370.1 hypothetical protein BFL40_19185 [Pseudomonas costantinii]
MSKLEKLLHISERHLKKTTRQNGIVFKPYKPGEPIPEDVKGRLERMEEKLERMTESYEKLRVFVAIKQSEQEERPQSLPDTTRGRTACIGACRSATGRIKGAISPSLR